MEGTASAAELEQLNNYYNSFNDSGRLTKHLGAADLAAMEHRIKSKLDDRINNLEKPPVSIVKQKWLQIAAAVLICSATLVLLYTYKAPIQHKNIAASKTPAQEPIVNRYMKLPDGSMVILRHNSELILSPGFNRLQRVVFLTGEAYFDVKHDQKRPFIIHTGKITTTVLGTAFNIKAYPEQDSITVTVTRGLVSVAQNGKHIGLLRPAMQLTATSQSSHEVTSATNISTATKWVSEDMKFSNMSFFNLAKRLSERYHVTVNFKNPALEGCPISGRFKGTESLTDVLDILSVARNASYTMQDNHIIIDGPGCK